MHDQPKLQAYELDAMRQPIEGTVARGSVKPANALAPAGTSGQNLGGQNQAKGASGGGNAFPFPVTAEVLARGQERFNISCSPCHSPVGDGNGLIAQRGFRHPPTYHDDRLRQAPTSHFFDVITNGFGAMPSYADQVTVEDRWKIIAYIRALQLSQSASVNDVPPEDRAKLDATGQGAAPGEHKPEAHGPGGH